MGLPYNVMSKVHTHMDTNFPKDMKAGAPALHRANTSAHISTSKDMPQHYSLGIDPTTVQNRMPGVTPTGSIDYPSSGDYRR